MTQKILGLASAALLAAAPAWGTTEAVTDDAESAWSPPGAAAAPAESTGWVERATFTTDVLEREPLDSIDRLANDRTKVYYFTELRGMEGETVTHRWEFNGEVVAEVPFSVGGPRWRAYSVKKLEPLSLGEWTVTVVDSAGRVLRTDKLFYREVPPSLPAAPAPPASPAQSP
ncbi:MAG: DUF2914 domain-containing protein [Myxococcota bacterium]